MCEILQSICAGVKVAQTWKPENDGGQQWVQGKCFFLINSKQTSSLFNALVNL